MGMFDKDKLYGGTPIEKWVSPGVDFILRGATIVTDEFPLDNGQTATKTELYVSSLDNPAEVYKVSTLSGNIASNVKDAEDSDFPAVVQFHTVPSATQGYSDAKAIKLVAPYDGESVAFTPDEVRDAPEGAVSVPGSSS